MPFFVVVVVVVQFNCLIVLFGHSTRIPKNVFHILWAKTLLLAIAIDIN